jgi:hypothetical protein
VEVEDIVSTSWEEEEFQLEELEYEHSSEEPRTTSTHDSLHQGRVSLFSLCLS